jgi:hypothetical protein
LYKELIHKGYEECIDSTKPSWLGKKIVHTSKYEYLLFNSNKDIIRIKTNGNIDDNLILYKFENSDYRSKK